MKWIFHGSSSRLWGASHITGPMNNIYSTLRGSFISTHYILVLFISPGEYSYVAISSLALSVCSHAHLAFGTESRAAQTITTTFYFVYIPGCSSTKFNPLAISVRYALPMVYSPNTMDRKQIEHQMMMTCNTFE